MNDSKRMASRPTLTRRGFLASAATVLASAAVSLASGPVAAFAGEATSEKIVIVHSNDVHCRFDNQSTGLGYSKLVDYTSEQRKTYGLDNVSLVDAGDFLQGETVGLASKGTYPSQLLQACGFDVMTLGNHEFEYGIDTLQNLCQTYDLPVVCCNLTDATGTPLYDSYKILNYQIDGRTVRVGYVGVLTPSTIDTFRPNFFRDDDGNYRYLFCQDDETGDQLAAAVQTAVDAAHDAGADYVVLLSHLGQTGSAARWRSDTVVSKTRGIDVVVDGHSHETYVQTVKNLDNQDVVISQAGVRFSAFGCIKIDPASGSAVVEVTASGVDDGEQDTTQAVDAQTITQWDGSDAQVAAVSRELVAEVNASLGDVIGTADVELARPSRWDDDNPPRAVGANLSDLACDALLHYCQEKGHAADVSIIYACLPQKAIAAGDITLGNVYDSFTYASVLEYLPVSGQHILDMLEVGVSKMPGWYAAFPAVSAGLEVEYRYDIESPVRRSDGINVDGFEGARRVVSAKLNGVEIDPAETYGLATIGYLLYRHGFGMPAPAGADNSTEFGTDIDAVAWYIKTYLGGRVSEQYQDVTGQNRVRVWSGEPSGDGADDGSDPASDETDGADGSEADGADVPATGDAAVPAAAVAVLGAAGILAASACDR